GGQLAPVSTAEDLLRALDTAFSDGTFRQLDLTYQETTIATFNLTEDGYSLQSGAQSLRFDADWPATVSELFETLKSVAIAGDARDPALSDEDRMRLLLDSTQWRGFSIWDAGTELIHASAVENTVTLRAEGLSFSIESNRLENDLHVKLEVAGTDSSTKSFTKYSSANLSELKGRVPDAAEALDLVLTDADIARVEALSDHTYITYTLDQRDDGPFEFELNMRVDHFFAEAVAPAITGTEEADQLTGTAADDLFLGLEGDDTLDGGAGYDAARFYGLSDTYHIEITPDGTQVTDRRPDAAGMDHLTNFELIQFDDLTVSLRAATFDPPASPGAVDDLVALYIGFFDRAPDAQGLLFWIEAHLGGMSLEEISDHFFQQPEAEPLRALAQSPETFVTQAYANVLDRLPDAAGLEFWTEMLADTHISPGHFVLHLLRGAQAETAAAEDTVRLSALTDIGLHYASVQGLSSGAAAHAVLDLWDGTEASKVAAFAAIDDLLLKHNNENSSLTIGYSALLDYWVS
ncbi:MAG: DUF4214 domain-containing protein, partial [Rhodobacteraceae bacterium]|nr:DUF4214 domain-containing protein [Paracoccaceae bacterium]